MCTRRKKYKVQTVIAHTILHTTPVSFRTCTDISENRIKSKGINKKIQSQFIAGINDMLGAFFPVPCFNFCTNSISRRRSVEKIFFIVKPARHYKIRQLIVLKIVENNKVSKKNLHIKYLTIINATNRAERVDLFTAPVLYRLEYLIENSSTRIPTDTGCNELNVNGK